MADKRIYELTDEQASYSADLELVVDDDTFTEAKRVKMSTIYKKASSLSAASGVNTSTYLLKVDNGAGAETKITLDSFFELFTNTLQVVFYNSAGTNCGTLRLRRTGKVVAGAFDVNVGSGSTSLTPVYATSAGSGGDRLTLDAEWRPVYDCVNYLQLSGNANAIQFNADGTIDFTIAASQGLAVAYGVY